MSAVNLAVYRPPVQGGNVPTVERFRELKDKQRKLEAEARKVAKEAGTLETALADAVEANGGMLEAGPYVLAFEFKDGTPAYKGICEQVIKDHGLPAGTLAAHVAATEKRRVLVIA